MTRRLRTPRRDGDDQRHGVKPRDPQAMSAWGWVMTRQLARLPEGRLVTRVEAWPVLAVPATASHVMGESECPH
jgi:hypothetical protein